jgi:hypothetical protein
MRMSSSALWRVPRNAARTCAGAITLAAVLLGTTGCGSSDITTARLEAAVGPTYKNLYGLQQHMEFGASGLTPPVSSAAHCTKGGKTVQAGGPGNDWACEVQWMAPNGQLALITYEVEVRPDGCYTAQGPSSLVGQSEIDGADSRTHTNPLYAFDGCFDTTG